MELGLSPAASCVPRGFSSGFVTTDLLSTSLPAVVCRSLGLIVSPNEGWWGGGCRACVGFGGGGGRCEGPPRACSPGSNPAPGPKIPDMDLRLNGDPRCKLDPPGEKVLGEEGSRGSLFSLPLSGLLIDEGSKTGVLSSSVI